MNINDIAQQAGVSIATVSRVLNGSTLVSPKTRAQVLAVAEACGYTPSAVAKSLSTRATHNVGVIFPDIENPFFSGALKGISQAAELARRYGADIIITLGKSGAVFSEGGHVSFVSAKEVRAIETTGAGDSFIGGVGYALLQGMGLTAACEFATACSAITVCRLGAQDSMPTMEEVQHG